MSAPVYTFRDARLRSPLLRSVNAAGEGLGAIGLRLPTLDTDAIEAQARARSGNDMALDRETREALERYIRSAESDAQLNTLGRLAVKDMLVGALASRFSVLAWHERHPALEKEKIERPWIVVGLPRTGTSILSILLGLDPLSRPIRQWEASDPIPPAGLAEAGEDPRIAAFSRQVKRLSEMNPAVATMHPFGSTLAEECTAVFTYALRTIGMETIAFTPSYGEWLDSTDMAPAYDIHKRTLQALQQAQPTGCWVLKSPNHLWCLPALLQAYPDARIIWTHRDPAKVLPSLASLNCAMQTQFTRAMNPWTVGRYWASKVERALDAATDFDDAAQPGWCYHLQYRDLIAKPLEALADIYAGFGSTMNDLHVKRVEAWLKQKPQHANGVHAYSAADFGWTDRALNHQFRHYQERYAIPLEN